MGRLTYLLGNSKVNNHLALKYSVLSYTLEYHEEIMSLFGK